MNLGAIRQPRGAGAFWAGVISALAPLFGVVVAACVPPERRQICALLATFGGVLVPVLVMVLVEALSRHRDSLRLDGPAMRSADILGVSRRASAKEARAAFTKLAKELNPDSPGAPPDAAEQLRLLQDAYQVLKERRKEWENRSSSKPVVGAPDRFAVISSLLARFAGRDRSERSAIETPPGMHLNRFAQRLPKRTYEHVLRPCLAEMQEEYFAALQVGDDQAAKRARFWGVVSFWATVARLILVEPLIKIALKLRT